MTRRVDDVDLVVFPKARDGRGGDRDSTLFFLSHPVGRRAVAVTTDFTDLVVDSGTVQDAFGGGRLTCVDMRDDTDVTVPF